MMDAGHAPGGDIDCLPEPERGELLALCEAHGIGTGYHDIWGHYWRVPVRGLRGLLQAMGVAAGDAPAVHAALAAWHTQRAQPPALPPVIVCWSDERPGPVRAGVAAGAWELSQEDGTRHSGELAGGQLVLPEALPEGYHELSLPAVAGARAVVIVAPRRAYLPPDMEQGRRVWGPAVQLYALRSARNWGIGDFTDLCALARLCGRHGAAIVGLNPLHALYPHQPEHASPYSPSSRAYLNVLYLDVEAVPEFAQCEAARAQVASAAFQERLQALRAAVQVDYTGVAQAKLPVLQMLHECFVQQAAPGTARHAAFEAFRAREGVALRRYALFQALQEYFFAADPSVWGWPRWPAALHDPDSAAVETFAAAHAERIAFHEYLQWLADEQLAAAGLSCLDSHLGVGLYQDLAVSVDSGGADAWSNQEVFAPGAGVGCPPDDFNLQGQDWGLLPLLPEVLQRQRFAPFIAALRAGMRNAGALRIDHVMGLARLFWLPRGDVPAAGAYVTYPFDALLAITTLESRRNSCIVIGEDLGTVPDNVRHAMDVTGLLSYRLMVFSYRDGGGFLAPAQYRRDALVTAATHDQATLAGYWEQRDIALRVSLGLYPKEELRERQQQERLRDRAWFLEALAREGLLPPGVSPEAVPDTMSPELAGALQQFLARTPSRVLVVQLEDVFGSRDQVNLPGTVDEYANWRRKVPVALEDWETDGRFAELARRMAAEGRA